MRIAVLFIWVLSAMPACAAPYTAQQCYQHAEAQIQARHFLLALAWAEEALKLKPESKPSAALVARLKQNPLVERLPRSERANQFFAEAKRLLNEKEEEGSQLMLREGSRYAPPPRELAPMNDVPKEQGKKLLAITDDGELWSIDGEITMISPSKFQESYESRLIRAERQRKIDEAYYCMQERGCYFDKSKFDWVVTGNTVIANRNYRGRLAERYTVNLETGKVRR